MHAVVQAARDQCDFISKPGSLGYACVRGVHHFVSVWSDVVSKPCARGSSGLC